MPLHAKHGLLLAVACCIFLHMQFFGEFCLSREGRHFEAFLNVPLSRDPIDRKLTGRHGVEAIPALLYGLGTFQTLLDECPPVPFDLVMAINRLVNCPFMPFSPPRTGQQISVDIQ